MVDGGDQHDGIGGVPAKFHVATGQVGGAGHAEVNLTGAQHLHRLLLGGNVARNLHPGVAAMEAGQQVGQDVLARRRGTADQQVAVNLAIERAHRFLDIDRAVDDIASQGQQGAAGAGQDDIAAGAGE